MNTAEDPNVSQNNDVSIKPQPNEQANTKIEQEAKDLALLDEQKPEIQYFHCSTCIIKERYEYFGRDPPFIKDYKLEEDAYIIEDPFLPPKRGEFLVLGAHCIKCNKAVCKDSNCSIYYSGTYCIMCAKECAKLFPKPLQEKLNRIVVPL